MAVRDSDEEKNIKKNKIAARLITKDCCLDCEEDYKKLNPSHHKDDCEDDKKRRKERKKEKAR